MLMIAFSVPVLRRKTNAKLSHKPAPTEKNSGIFRDLTGEVEVIVAIFISIYFIFSTYIVNISVL